MIHNNSAPRLVLARNVLPWAQYPDAYTAAKNITDVSVANIVNVGSGELVRGEQYISAYWSARFKHCSALIMRSTVTIGFDFAHCWPDAQEILRPMQQNDRLIPDEAAFVYGSNSPSQHSLELFLAARGTKIHSIRTETGRDGSEFGVLVDCQSGLVSVIREDPNKMIFQYLPFEL